MARKNKAKRKTDRTRKKLNRKRRKAERKANDVTIPDGYSTPLLKTFEYENPLARLTDEQRSAFAKCVGEGATQKFVDSMKELRSSILSTDPAQLLSAAALYTLYQGAGTGSDYTKEGPYTQAIVELLQSVCLMYPQDLYEPWPAFHESMFNALDLCKECSQSFAMMRMSSLADADEDERRALLTAEEARMHTQVMRNWGYPQHMRRIVRELLTPLEQDFKNAVGIGPVSYLKLTDRISNLTSDRIMRWRDLTRPLFRKQNLRKTVSTFLQLTGKSDEHLDEMYREIQSKPGPPQAKQFRLISYFHQFLPRCFTFTLEELAGILPDSIKLEKLRTTLDSLAFEFGDLASEDPEHLVMQSKIRTRPLIKLQEDQYFVPVQGLLNSFLMDVVESWAKSDSKLKKRYHKRRAVYLETSLKDMLDAAFPNCVIKTGTCWFDTEESKEYENDCLVVCGPLALVFEAKSESVDDVAKRGGSKTLADHYESLVDDPAEQAARLAKLLEEGTETRTFKTKKDGEYTLNLSKIKRAICVAVTLDSMPASSLCWKKLVASGMVTADARPAINLSLADLMIVLAVLDTPGKRVHYFWRRTEWELNVAYLADELDLLVFYLSEGLLVPRLQDKENSSLMLYGNSDELHRHYMADWAGEENPPPLPRRILTEWWSSILERVESLGSRGCWDIACVLLDLDYRRQQQFEKQFGTVIEKVKREGNDCGLNGLITHADHTESIGAVVAFAYQNLDKEERDGRALELAAQAQSESGAARVVVIGKEVNSTDEPYSFLAFIDDDGIAD
ncbi:MAG: hypothetical protein KDB00_23865 [Planctomycetales bacterium]|nr:hypothetical protein [Planctomycetales bacterium]